VILSKKFIGRMPCKNLLGPDVKWRAAIYSREGQGYRLLPMGVGKSSGEKRKISGLPVKASSWGRGVAALLRHMTRGRGVNPATVLKWREDD